MRRTVDGSTDPGAAGLGASLGPRSDSCLRNDQCHNPAGPLRTGAVGRVFKYS